MRSKYGDYPEYHTSLDDLNFISPKGLFESYKTYKKIVECIEMNDILYPTVLCEPQLGKRGLYPTISTKNSKNIVKDMMNFLAYCDGSLNNLEIAEKINVPLWKLKDIIDKLKKENILKEKEN